MSHISLHQSDIWQDLDGNLMPVVLLFDSAQAIKAIKTDQTTAIQCLSLNK